MKTFKFLSNTALVFSLVMLASCSSNDDLEETGYRKQKLEFKANIDLGDSDGVTRATLESDYSMTWDENDQISVFCDNNEESVKFVVIPSSVDGSIATFTNYGEELPMWFDPNYFYYALYPHASASFNVSTSKITAVLPTNQYVSSSRNYDKNALLMAACADNDEKIFNFKNIPALIKVTVSENGAGHVRFIEIESKNTANILSGNFEVSPTYNTSQIGIRATSNAEKKHTVKLQIPASAEAQDFYLAVLPGTINGLTLKFENASGSVESQHESSKTVEFKRSKIYDFGTYVIDKEIK